MSTDRRVGITGLSINTPIGNTPEVYLESLLQGRSAVRNWTSLDTGGIYSKVGADLGDFEPEQRLRELESRLPRAMWQRLKKLHIKSPWATKVTTLLAADALLDAGLLNASSSNARHGVIVGGHNFNFNYDYQNRTEFDAEPDYIDSLFALQCLDTDHAASVSEVLGTTGPLYTVGAACASGNAALRAAIDEIRYHDVDVVFVVGPVLDWSPFLLHAMGLLGAISINSFHDEPHRASRPYDVRREGFVPAHGGGCLVVEALDHAVKRGARPYAEVLAVESSSDANHLPSPSQDGQAALIEKVMRRARIRPEEIEFVSAHATSTPLGDVSEIEAIKRSFGDHAYKLKLNAPKSMLGHTCWAAPVVELVAALLQMRAGRLHPSINIDELDPRVDLDVCANESCEFPFRTMMKNSFGFGGINSISILRKWEA